MTCITRATQGATIIQVDMVEWGIIVVKRRLLECSLGEQVRSISQEILDKLSGDNNMGDFLSLGIPLRRGRNKESWSDKPNKKSGRRGDRVHFYSNHKKI